MTIQKQKDVLECLSNGRYKVQGDEIFYYHKAKNEWKKLTGNKLKSNYTQLLLFKGRGEGKPVVCYKHIAIYLAVKGMYPAGWKIDHKDRNNQNDLPDNLEAKTQLLNLENSQRTVFPKHQLIRSKEIKTIRILLANGYSQSHIARAINRNRTSVINIIRKIEAGSPLRFE